MQHKMEKLVTSSGCNMLTVRHEIIFLRNYAQDHEDASAVMIQSCSFLTSAREVVSGQYHAVADT
jgi:hypothetical protein